jgi:hypothetical protein
MDHLSHAFSGQSQTAHRQPQLHRRSRSCSLRTKGRLPRRVLRRRSADRTAADFRGHLRSRAESGEGSRLRISAGSASTNLASPCVMRQRSPAPHRPAATCSRGSTATRKAARQPIRELALVMRDIVHHPRDRRSDHSGARAQVRRQDRRGRAALVLEPPSGVADFCEPAVNSPCGNPFPHPRIKPVIAGDTTCSVSLLTDTICGSKFAIP